MTQRTNMSHGPMGNKPVYAQGRKDVAATADHADLTYHIWHKVTAIQPSKAPETALGRCGQRFEPEGFLYAERTLLEWGDDDDVCECAAVIPSEEQCKAVSTRVLIGERAMLT